MIYLDLPILCSHVILKRKAEAARRAHATETLPQAQAADTSPQAQAADTSPQTHLTEPSFQAHPTEPSSQAQAPVFLPHKVKSVRLLVSARRPQPEGRESGDDLPMEVDEEPEVSPTTFLLHTF